MYGKNIYYNPEAFGLKVIAEIDYSDGNYVFDTRVVWKTIKGQKFYTARDSGCSCPTPFEDYNLDNIDPLSLVALRNEVTKELADKYVNISHETAQEFLDKVRVAKS